MSISGGIFGRDLARLRTVGNPDARLDGRPNTDPAVLSEWAYFEKHGMTRAQASEQAKARRRDDFIDEAVRGLTGEPPQDICNVRGLGPKRALFARFTAWRCRETIRQSELLTRKTELEAMIAAPAATEAAIRAAVKNTAAALMGRDSGEPKSSRKTLDDRLSSERHTAEAAAEALSEVEAEIEIANLRVARLDEREGEFLNPAMVEVADDIGLGDLYLKKIAELREVSKLIFGLAEVAGGYGSGFEGSIAVKMPRAGFHSIAKRPASDFAIEGARVDVWRGLAQSLLLDPRHDASKFIPLPR
jgi:hypothetical protein